MEKNKITHPPRSYSSDGNCIAMIALGKICGEDLWRRYREDAPRSQLSDFVPASLLYIILNDLKLVNHKITVLFINKGMWFAQYMLYTCIYLCY